ncbi:MAG TPA: SDR family oxidoreductase [Tepidisphaeraceae bacterium]|jgi:short-subunit dehydrogenase
MQKRHYLLLGGLAGAFLGARAVVRHKRFYSLAGKNVLVTGGSRGLGLVLARQLVRRGARVAICARNLDDLERARQDLAARGGTVISVQCDLTDQNQVDLMVCSVRKTLGPIDVLINNAGTIVVGPIQTMDAQDFDTAMCTHFYGPMYTTLAVLSDMRETGGGRIVNISSIGGLVSVPHLTPYVASKFALTGFSQGMRTELLRENIFVTTVYPGLMRTGSPRNVTVKGNHKLEYALFKMMDSLPVSAMSAERAARQIINAMMHGQSNVVLSIQAKAAAKINALFPGLTNDAHGFLNMILPKAKDGDRRAMRGHEAESLLSKSPLTMLTDWAAARNNEH